MAPETKGRGRPRSDQPYPPPPAKPAPPRASKALWKDVAEACEWERPRAPSVRLLWDVRAVGAVPEFLRTTSVGCIGTEGVLPEDVGEDADGGDQAHPRMIFPTFFFS